MKRDYAKFRELLEAQEKFPLDFMFKFIGRNSAEFRKGVRELELEFPKLRIQTSRESSEGHHLAMTYKLMVANSQEVIDVFERIHVIPDVTVVL